MVVKCIYSSKGNKMIIVQITGGMGNQMFQYATGKALSLYHNVELKLDLEGYKREVLPELEVSRKFELPAFKNFSYKEASKNEIEYFISANWVTKNLQRLKPPHKRKVYIEKQYPFDTNFFSANKSIYIKGYRQSEKYFLSYKDEIRNTYQLKAELIEEVVHFGQQLRNENSIAIHIRRGDYLRLPIISDWHGVLGIDYYSAALEIITTEIPDAKLYYYSDDPEWVQQELMPLYPGTIVSNIISKNHYHDFYLIQCCKHQVVANSSFSWWAAWLNPNPNKIVIAPKKWFNRAPFDTKDIIPPSWIRI